jgi:hypothetical protein
LAKIVPLFKSDNNQHVTNYIPISLLPTLSKVLEKVVHQQLYRHSNKNNLICNQQYGFRPNHNCGNILQKLQNTIFLARNSKKHVLAVFLDLKKAFDCVRPDILSAKIKHYGLPVGWFEKYILGKSSTLLWRTGPLPNLI